MLAQFVAPEGAICLGSSLPLPGGHVRESYVLSDTREPLAPYVVGMVQEVITLDDNSKILVLCPPITQTPWVIVIFQHQLNLLQNLVLNSPSLIPRLVVSVESWCHSAESQIFIRYTDAADLDLNQVRSIDLNELGFDVPVVCKDAPLLEHGAIVLCHVSLYRTDTVVSGSSSMNSPVYHRAYALEASHISRFSRLA
ncbi:hypothetical protein C8R43DRAFT_1120268 [Mycena crocata]|nr:hypothetical protein C8R43DRAFT_1120268 [Mycena crocata]